MCITTVHILHNFIWLYHLFIGKFSCLGWILTCKWKPEYFLSLQVGKRFENAAHTKGPWRHDRLRRGRLICLHSCCLFICPLVSLICMGLLTCLSKTSPPNIFVYLHLELWWFWICCMSLVHMVLECGILIRRRFVPAWDGWSRVKSETWRGEVPDHRSTIHMCSLPRV